MNFRRIAVVALILLFVASPAHAALSPEWQACVGGPGYTPDQSIAGCTTIITSGRESNENLAIAYYNRGLAYNSKGQYDRAIQDYDQAIRLKPDFALAYGNRGFSYLKKGSLRDLDQAIADSQQALRLDPSLGRSYLLKVCRAAPKSINTGVASLRM